MSMLVNGEYAAPGDVIVRRPADVLQRREWFRTPLDVSASLDKESKRYSRTQQHFREECDINTIMKRFEKTGVLDHLAQYEGRYGDFTEVPQSYHEAVNQVIAADEMFMTIPAKIRALFNNDAGEFLAFVENPENEAKLVELGLARARPQAEDLDAPDPADDAG